jgi:beta-phosphoglucomutase family hydrolase
VVTLFGGIRVFGLPDGIRACLFDLDGVLTQTDKVHLQAWTEAFDEFLLARFGEAYQPFTDRDYLNFVDGKPRQDGVRDFLASRGIELPAGGPGDAPGDGTVGALANRKNALLLAKLARDGIKVYDGSVRYLRAVRAAGFRTAVVTASANGAAVLDTTKLSRLFDVRIDGVVAATEHLRGKPAPDTYLAAARALGVPAGGAAVFEDALAGVAAGRAGGFGLVVGIARNTEPEAMKERGADVVVRDLAELLGAS